MLIVFFVSEKKSLTLDGSRAATTRHRIFLLDLFCFVRFFQVAQGFWGGGSGLFSGSNFSYFFPNCFF
jgi:hypothetical protein